MVVKISPKYQVVIPEAVRETLGLKAGMKVDVIAKGRIAYLVPVVEMEDLKKQLKSKLNEDKGQKLPLRDKKDRIK